MPIKKLFKLKKSKDSSSNVDSPNNPFISGNKSNPLESGSGNVHTKSVVTTPNQGELNSGSNSNSFTSSNSLFTISNNSNIANQYQHVNNTNLPKELVPIITLLNCHNSRVYRHSEFNEHISFKAINFELINTVLQDQSDFGFEQVDTIVKGNQLILFKKGLESSFKPISLNLPDSSIKVDEHITSIVVTTNMMSYVLRFQTLRSVQEWISSMTLSVFEFNKLNESYTASLLSAKATMLSDIHVVMSESRYNHEERCSINLNGTNEWVDCYCVITPSEKSWKTTKNGTISFYSSARATKKNLICSISDIENAFAIYPNNAELIDDSTLLKIDCDLKVFNEKALVENSVNSVNASRSNSGKNSPIRSRSNSLQKTPDQGHFRNGSISSISSIKSNKGIHLSNTSIYVLPSRHHGVKNFETLIRFLIPVYDSFQLYGRPKRLIAERSDLNSLLFGLPNLPSVEYLTTELAEELVLDNWTRISTLENSDGFDYNQLFASYIKELYNEGRYKGFGDLKKSLYNELSFENPLTKTSFSVPEFDTPSPTSPTFSGQDYQSPRLPLNNLKLSSPIRMGSYSSNLNSLTEEQEKFTFANDGAINNEYTNEDPVGVLA